jgi:hypothetical protein
VKKRFHLAFVLMLGTIGIPFAPTLTLQSVSAGLADLENVTPAAVNETMPVYDPPKERTRGGRLSSITRGTHDQVALVALAPNHVGLTKHKQPNLYWYLSKPTTSPIEFTFIDSRAIAPVVETRLTPPKAAGIQAIRLADYGVSLVPGVVYRWFVALVRDPEASSRDIVAGAVLEHVDYIEAL